jgi:hypothetical protein
VTAPAPCTDPASAVIDAVIATMKILFDPKSDCPPIGGGSTTVRFYAGEGAFLDEFECNQPLLWVRFNSRYRSESFPDNSMVLSPCGAGEVITVEVGVARCSMYGGDITAKQSAKESEISLDDTWRLNKVACVLKGQLDATHQVGQESVVAWGPEGGIVAWATMLYISL